MLYAQTIISREPLKNEFNLIDSIMSDNNWRSYVEDIDGWERPNEQLTEYAYREFCGWNQVIRNARDALLRYIHSADYRLMCERLTESQKIALALRVRQLREMYASYLSGESESESG